MGHDRQEISETVDRERRLVSGMLPRPAILQMRYRISHAHIAGPGESASAQSGSDNPQTLIKTVPQSVENSPQVPESHDWQASVDKLI